MLDQEMTPALAGPLAGDLSSLGREQEGVQQGALSGPECSFTAHWENYDTIVAGAHPSCRHCNARKEAIVQFIPYLGMNLADALFTFHDHEITDPGNELWFSSNTAESMVQIEFLFVTELDRTLKDPFYSDIGKEGLEVKVGSLAPVTTASQESLEFSLSCIRHCINNHATCGSGSDQPLPTRILFIGTYEDPCVQLHVPSYGKRGRYLCLSHCWGSQSEKYPMLKTTRDTIDRFRSQVPWPQMPKTFQDAVQFARKLEVQYLWIDALCIVQDDEDDVAYETGQMARVYSNAFLTLAAASATSSTGGLYVSKSGRYTEMELPIASSDPHFSRNGTLYARRAMPHVGIFEFPLLIRGWVLQERLLSKRVLYFTAEELIWECLTASGCECHTDIHTSEAKSNLIIQEMKDKATRDLLWADCVRTYTQMHLTYNADTLPGLSGLAKFCQTIYADEYLAGIWRDSLVPQLLWHRFPGQASSVYQAPSWSWASWPIGATAFFPQSDNIQSLVEILDACCVPAYASDPTGAVSSGYISFFAKAASGRLEYRKPDVGFDRVHCRSEWRPASADGHADSEQLDVYVVAMGSTEKALHFLMLSSNHKSPETFTRRGVCSMEFESIGEDKHWWVSQGGDGWMQFTVV